MTVQEQWISAEEFWEIAHRPENADKHMELIEGVIYAMPPAGLDHGAITGNFFGFIWTHVRSNDLGRVTAAETGYVLYTDPSGKDVILAPDVGFVIKERAAALPSQKYAPLAPDLAVEVVSPSDSAEAIQAKVSKYLQYGTRMVCVVYPTTRSMVVHTRDGAHTLTEADTFDGGDVLPGFSLPVRDIFST